MELKEEKRENLESFDSSRRNFLKFASTGIILASGLFNSEETEAKTTSQMPKTMKFLIYDPALCTGCGTCEMVCSTILNNGKSSYHLSAIKVYRDPFGTTEDNYSPLVCYQCVDAPCVKACPNRAVKIDTKSGINTRVIDESKCKGSRKCIQACPYEDKRIVFIREKNKSIKCHLCNGNPQCVKFCPNGTLKFVGPPDFTPIIEYLPEKNKQPMVPKSYQIVLLEDRNKELGYPREE